MRSDWISVEVQKLNVFSYVAYISWFIHMTRFCQIKDFNLTFLLLIIEQLNLVSLYFF